MVSKLLKEKGTAWWKVLKHKGLRVPPCATPKDPKNSPKTALSHICIKPKVIEIEGSYFVLKRLIVRGATG